MLDTVGVKQSSAMNWMPVGVGDVQLPIADVADVHTALFFRALPKNC